MLDLDFNDFYNFFILGFIFKVSWNLINLFPHLYELNLVAAALTQLKISKDHLCN